MTKISVDQCLNKAKAHIKRGDIHAAKNLYEDILASYPENRRAKAALLSINSDEDLSSSQEFSPQIVEEFMALYSTHNYEEILFRAKAVLAKYPKASPIWNFLGAALMGLKNPEGASNAFYKATQINPYDSAAYNNLGEALRNQNKLEEAIDAYNKAVELNPSYAEAYSNKSQALESLGELDEALIAVSSAIVIKPDFCFALKNMGYWLWKKGNLREAADKLQRAQTLDKDPLLLIIDLSRLLEQLGELEQSYEVLEKAISIEPKSIQILNRLGENLFKQNRFSEANDVYVRATKYDPHSADAHYNLANFYKNRGQVEKALSIYERAIHLKPELKEAHLNKGKALKALGRFEEATVALGQAVSVDPKYSQAYNLLGTIFSENGLPWKAIEAYHKAIQLNPNFAEAHNNLGNSFKSLKKSAEALDYFNKAVAIRPSYEVARTAKFHMEAQICDWSAMNTHREWLPKLGVNDEFVTPWVLLALEDNPARQKKRSELYAKSFCPKVPTWEYSHPTVKPTRLRIGYFSADFHNFPGMYLMAGLLEEHDRAKFEVLAFSYGPKIEDEMRQRISIGVDEFIDINGKTLEETLQIARNKRIDIAFHRNGHTRNSRTDIFAHRVAPIQINYLGYPGTLGADYIDYMIADETVIPQEHREHYTEKLIVLPHSYQPNDNKRKISSAVTKRSDFGLPENGLVFCCFNNSYKIGAKEFEIWVRVMKQFDGSVLWLLGSGDLTVRNLRTNAEVLGLEPSRLIFADIIPQGEHLARHQHADLFLDTFHYNAHTTASDALWAGLPVVTKLGQQFSSRVCGSLLTAIGLPELITHTAEDYEALIFKLAQAPKLLSSIRDKLQANRKTQPLFDTTRYARNFESGLFQAYDQFFEGKDPVHITIKDSD